jgi:methyl-accepting chemotaxis protein
MARPKRKNYFIDKQFQTKYIVLTILLLMIYTLLFVVILFLPYIIPLSFEFPLDEQAKAARTLLTLHQSIWPALGSVMLIMGIASIFITHNMAGPIYCFRNVLSEISRGNLEVSANLRKKADFKDLADDLNVVIGELRTFVNTLQGEHETMSSCINELENQFRDNQVSNEAGKEVIDKMLTSNESTAQALKKYSKP